ncbi:MAG: hypothetical protein DMD81_07130, partial [Candidatus Rokuibacteriota bacterium]
LENRFGIDVKFQCWAFSLEVVDRNIAGRPNTNEVRFTLNLLGMGGPLSTSMGLGSLTSTGGTSAR